MQLNYVGKLFLSLLGFCLFVSTGFCASSYDRELIVQDKTRAMQVESVFKEMMAAYEDEDARGFLDYVSDERFRQDYITFTDALYSDFRNYEIHQVEYWIDKVVPDNVKQFLFVRWEKRYENLDDGRQLTQRGVSRFLFDEVEGDYLLIELAGNQLFGASLPEWVQEVPPISGQEMTAVATEPGAVCDEQHLNLCDASNCAFNNGYWYDNSCHQTPYNPAAVCDSQHLELCDSTNCDYPGPGYWYDNTCNATPQGQPDLTVAIVDWMSGTLWFTVTNSGTVASTACTLQWMEYPSVSMPYTDEMTIGPVAAGSSVSLTFDGVGSNGQLTIDSTNVVSESNESNNVTLY
ncbi:CARDB domain-containing protein [uncultured Desulfuromusa sp.]|uniref:CARDB domain-containing protein n=1 Tax=uncultured Desulfuromusa sp. TaxID=219183 RepID=UPI002AA7D81B|nr:CARDB domain-containing protein [uncultured Desulfuromusa sp.]